jgi:hypothetical protein
LGVLTYLQMDNSGCIKKKKKKKNKRSVTYTLRSELIHEQCRTEIVVFCTLFKNKFDMMFYTYNLQVYEIIIS